MQQEEERKEANTALVLAVAAVGVFGLWAWIGTWIPWDGVSALFGGLAFAGVIVTMHQQQQELRLQRRELQLQRQEMRGQKEQLEAQEKTMRLQAFESTFFRLLAEFRGLAQTLGHPSVGGAPGPMFWQALSNSVFGNDTYRQAQGNITAEVSAYEHIYGRTTSALSPYFVTLQELLNFLARSPFADERIYARLLRAQITPNEVLLIGYHGISQVGRDHLKPLLERFGILRYLPTGPAWPSTSLSHPYATGAFQD